VSKSRPISSKSYAATLKLLSTIFRSEIRPKILRAVATSEEPTYISKVAKQLKVNKRTVLVNLSTLEDRGLVKSRWKTIKVKGKPTLVKQFTVTPLVDNPAVKELLA
jgi:DNA-binding transcriptional ArsR family regulator